MLVPQVLIVKDKNGTIIGRDHQLALALCLLNIQPSARVVVKGKALIPRRIQKELVDLGVARFGPEALKLYLNVHIPKLPVKAQEDIKEELRGFVDLEEFEGTRESWAREYHDAVQRQRWRYMNFGSSLLR